MRILTVTPDPSEVRSGTGSRTSRRSLALDLRAFGARVRETALRGPVGTGVGGDGRWLGVGAYEGLGSWATLTITADVLWGSGAGGSRHPLGTWTHMALGIADEGGVVLVVDGWFFLSTGVLGQRQIASRLLWALTMQEHGGGAVRGSSDWDRILDLFDKRITKPSRVSAALGSLSACWSSHLSVVDRLGAVLLEG